MLILEDRLLLNDGSSIVNEDYAASVIMREGKVPDHIKVIDTPSTKRYNTMYHTNITSDGKENPIHAEFVEEFDIQTLIAQVVTVKRDNTPEDEHLERVRKEMLFFQDSDNMKFLCNVKKFIDKLDTDGIVWGGRGSSCASYILYLLKIHDVNPIKYGISFSEFSKQEEKDV